MAGQNEDIHHPVYDFWFHSPYKNVVLHQSKAALLQRSTVSDFPRFVASLLLNAEGGGKMFITNEETGQVFQFSKLGNRTSEDLSLSFHYKQSETEIYESLKHLLPPNVIISENHNGSIIIENIQGVELSLEVLKIIFYEININIEEIFTIHYDYIPFFDRKATKTNIEKYKKYLSSANKKINADGK